jgi:hypothetical protein
MIVQAGEIKKMIDAAQQVVFGNVVFEIERLEKLSLILLIPSHHAKILPISAQSTGIYFTPSIIRVFQQHSHGSGHWDGRVLNYRYRREADIYSRSRCDDTA